MKSMSHPKHPRTPKTDNPTGWGRQGKSVLDTSHKNYSKDRMQGSPSSSDSNGNAVTGG